ncbi:cytidylate kinase [Candidatus Nitrososphaera evergladensis SR1]|jgi:cytidylate kinase|uniref:Cytidylate kinase n=1 Tax=Candidatus Nitrososphaera evergladensis SR1 TaxID=1459636 RepID=A0A075MTC6_9ARCH|nr:cytidylate kinase family protein [Candidatus Nitrososphaera evergladensis]AIF84831.1 cytidylate kinase [Candidatus Nitrososphaera evergladensis SR1]
MAAAKKPSIVISGWPAVGKTTIAGALAKEFGLTMYNGGDILKMLAREKGYSTDTAKSDWWDTPEAKMFMQERKRDPSFDKRVDKKLEEILKSESAVITSYTLPWLVNDSAIIKFWLKGSSRSRAKRMANRDGIAVAEAEKIVNLRDNENIKIYKNLYGFTFGEDLSVFDYALNTDLLSLDALIEVAKLIVRRQVGR